MPLHPPLELGPWSLVGESLQGCKSITPIPVAKPVHVIELVAVDLGIFLVEPVVGYQLVENAVRFGVVELEEDFLDGVERLSKEVYGKAAAVYGQTGGGGDRAELD